MLITQIWCLVKIFKNPKTIPGINRENLEAFQGKHLKELMSYSYCARSWHQQINPLRKKFSFGLKCYKAIGSYVSCAFIEIWSTWEGWRALKKLELLSATPWATLTHLSCSPNFPRASYLDERTLTYEPIVNFLISSRSMGVYFTGFTCVK